MCARSPPSSRRWHSPASPRQSEAADGFSGVEDLGPDGEALTAQKVVQSHLWGMHTFVCTRCRLPPIRSMSIPDIPTLSDRACDSLPDDTEDEQKTVEVAVSPAAEIDELELPLKEACEQFERQYVVLVLHRVRWNISRAARVLRVHRNTILRKLSAWGLERPDGEAGGARHRWE